MSNNMRWLDVATYLKVFISQVSCLPVRRSSLPVPYWVMCSAWVRDSFWMASSMAFMPPGWRMLSVEKLVWAPAPAWGAVVLNLKTINISLGNVMAVAATLRLLLGRDWWGFAAPAVQPPQLRHHKYRQGSVHALCSRMRHGMLCS